MERNGMEWNELNKQNLQRLVHGIIKYNSAWYRSISKSQAIMKKTTVRRVSEEEIGAPA